MLNQPISIGRVWSFWSCIVNVKQQCIRFFNSFFRTSNNLRAIKAFEDSCSYMAPVLLNLSHDNMPVIIGRDLES